MPPKTSPEKGRLHRESTEQKSAFIVEQPPALENILEVLSSIDKITESVVEDRSGDMGGAAAGTQGAAQAGTSARDQAIADMPSEPVVRKQLARHIEKEVKKLRKQVHRAARRVSKPGTAHRLNDLYAQIRRLNALLANLVELSYEVVKRLFIRVFIDKQPIL